jgi:hypothetical protein
MSKELLAAFRSVGVSACGDIVMLQFICGDPYEAQVLYDDLVARLNQGEEISIYNAARQD